MFGDSDGRDDVPPAPNVIDSPSDIRRSGGKDAHVGGDVCPMVLSSLPPVFRFDRERDELRDLPVEFDDECLCECESECASDDAVDDKSRNEYILLAVVGEDGGEDDPDAGVCRARACLSDCGRDTAPALTWRSARPAASARSCTSLANSTRSGDMFVSGRYAGAGTVRSDPGAPDPAPSPADPGPCPSGDPDGARFVIKIPRDSRPGKSRGPRGFAGLRGDVGEGMWIVCPGGDGVEGTALAGRYPRGMCAMVRSGSSSE